MDILKIMMVKYLTLCVRKILDVLEKYKEMFDNIKYPYQVKNIYSNDYND